MKLRPEQLDAHLREPLQPEHVKSRLLGHWGTTPGLNFIYAHMNRVIRRDDLDMIYLAGPGHGGPALVATLADADGIVVVERDQLAQLIPAAHKKVEDEAKRIAQIQQGQTAASWLVPSLRAAGVLKDGEVL